MKKSNALLGTALVFLASLALYVLLLQREPYGDGITYLVALKNKDFLAHHLFYVPPMTVFAQIVGWFGIDERTAAFFFSTFCAATGNAVLCWLLSTSRRLAPHCSCPIRLTALVATTPSLIFFATQVENHAHHYLWICVTLLALDRALAVHTRTSARAWSAWLLAGVALLAAFSSHSTSILLWPALGLGIWVFGGPVRRMPSVKDVRAIALFFGPAILFKFAQPQIKVAISGDANWGSDSTAAFALSLLEVRSLETWIDYLWSEFLLPAWGLIWAVLVLGIRRMRAHRKDWIIAVCATLPYLAFFGSWNVREFGAYYIPLLPVFIVGVGRLMPRLRLEEAIVLVLLIAGQATHGFVHARDWVDSRPAGAWNWAEAAARLAGKNGVVFCWDGARALHVEYDHPDVKAFPFHNWTLTLAGPAKEDPALWQKIADTKLTELIDDAHRAGGRAVVGLNLWQRIESDPSLSQVRPVLEKLESLGLVKVDAGVFRGWRVKRP